MSRLAKRAFAVASATVLLVAGLAALPANAAMDSNCWLTVSAPTDNDINVYATSTVTCSTYMDHTAIQVGNLLQESVLGIYVDRGEWKYNPSTGSTSLSVQGSTSCNGHGTDNWRGRGMGRTTDEGETWMFGSARSITC